MPKYLLAITKNKKADFGHTSRVVPNRQHAACLSADLIAEFKRGYRPGLYTSWAELLRNKI